jgi:peptidoglycan/xylan/chitin deacetylase (PgdA/CDA1 family)
MLLVLMYHGITIPLQKGSLAAFEQHLLYLKQHYPIVVPGETAKASLSICLTFDDAFFDFYHDVFPLLCRHQIKAVLGIPTQFILEQTQVPSDLRLQVPYPEGLKGTVYLSQAPFCTWEEIQEMVASGYVYPASHSHTHANLCDQNTDVEQELIISKNLLEQKLKQPIDTFIYPFGRMNHEVQKKVRQHYRYGLRIGAALNRSWEQGSHLIYRVDADAFWPSNRYFTRVLLLKFLAKFYLNRLRGK